MSRSISIENYHAHEASGALGRQAGAIYTHLSDGARRSRAELAMQTGMRLSSVCGRVNELLHAGLIEEGESRKCYVTGRTIRPVFRPRLGQMSLL